MMLADKLPGALLWRSSLRYLWRRPWQTWLTMAGIVLGVAVVVAVDLANASARRAFALSLQSVAGRVTHHLVGGPGGIAGEIYVELRTSVGIRDSAPLIIDHVVVGGETFTLLGVDPIAEMRLRRHTLSALAPGRSALLPEPLLELLTQPRAMAVSERAAARLRLRRHDSVTLEHRGREYRVKLADTFRSSNPAATEGLLFMDIAAAQELLGREGAIDQIDLILDPPRLKKVTAWVPESLTLQASEARDASLTRMSEAFHTNLTAMSLLALLVGGLLIYNTMTFSVLRRRRLLGIYRAQGVTRGEIFALVLGEALLTGVVSSAIGLGLGLLLGQGLVNLVTRTVNDLYFVLHVREFFISPLSLFKGACLGTGTALLAALLPALEAARSRPVSVQQRSALEWRWRRRLPPLAGAGAATLAAGWALVALGGGGLLEGFVALALIVFGFSLAIPLTLYLGVRALLWLFSVDSRLFKVGSRLFKVGSRLFKASSRLFKVSSRLFKASSRLFKVGSRLFKVGSRLFKASSRLFKASSRLSSTVRLGLKGINASVSRTGMAVAALAVAVSATVGVGVMVESFRYTLSQWLRQSLQGDVYISLPGPGSSRAGGGISPVLAETLRRLPEVAAVGRNQRLEVETGFGRLGLTVLEGDSSQRFSSRAFKLKEAAQNAMEKFARGEGILISEPLAHHRRLGVGGQVRVHTDRGGKSLPVLGVFFDYTSSHGLMAMHRNLYARLWNHHAISGLSVFAAGGVSQNELLSAVRAVVGGNLRVSSNREIRAVSLRIFDRTFAITRVLRMLAIAVAFIGVLSALMSVQLERMRELAILRATGMTRGQVAGLVIGQAGLMGVFAGLAAIPLGLIMAVVLLDVINLRSFGWSLQYVLPPGVLLEAVALSVISALLAGTYPAFKAASISPARALREE